jgi:hypothetical protein
LSTTSGTTQYSIDFDWLNGDNGSFSFSGDPVVWDPFMLSLAETMKGIVWPENVCSGVSLTKNTNQNTTYNADLTSTPPTFS